LLQTAFRNPLAAPDIFGVTSGANLAVALLTLNPVMAIAGAWVYVSSVAAAFVGAMTVTVVIWALSRVCAQQCGAYHHRHHDWLPHLQWHHPAQLLRHRGRGEELAVWGMGNFGNVSMAQMPFFAAVTLVATASTLLLMKPLNALLMGEHYAASLGIDVRRTRNILLALTGLLTAVVTAFCGPSPSSPSPCPTSHACCCARRTTVSCCPSPSSRQCRRPVVQRAHHAAG
jgi:iron complex transport system permease protein